MIKSIDLGNVRLFEGSGWSFPLSALTVFCGTNSAGKSTILRALLLLRQTLGIKENIAIGKAKLRFVGGQVDLGNYSSFISHNDTWRDLSIGLAIEGKMPAWMLAQLQSHEPPQDFAAQPRETTELAPYTLRCLFRFGMHWSGSAADQLETPPPEDLEDMGREQQPELKYSEYEISSDQKSLLVWKVEILDIDLEGRRRYKLILPKDYFDRASGLEGLDTVQLGLFGNVELPTFLRGLLPDRIIWKPAQADPSLDPSDEESWRIWPLPKHMERGLRDLRRSLTTIQYLGPLRAPGRRYYPQMDSEPATDSAGEFLPFFLRDRSELSVLNLRLGGSSPTQETLITGLNYWLGYLRTGRIPEDEFACRQELLVQTFQDLIVQLSVRSVQGNESHGLADSGFGYSQVLPILAGGLIARPGNTLIIEQPEVHLNPALQVRVTEFLVRMAALGKQILVETHSEHIVNTVRVASAEGANAGLTPRCNIFYLEAAAEKPTVHELSIRADGTVPDWPRTFFGEASSLAGRLLRAQSRLSRTPK